VYLFHDFIDNFDWLSYIRCFNDLDEAFSAFLCTLRSIFDFFFPFTTIRVRSFDKPWVLPSLKVLINARDRAYSRDQEAKYLRLRKQVILHIKHLKTKYFTDIAATKDQRKIWKSIRSFAGVHDRCRDPSSLPLPEEFSKFFTSVLQPKEHHCYPESSTLTSCFFSEFEVYKHLSSLKRKSCGPDGLPYWVFKRSSLTLSPVITYLFNWSVKAAHVPLCLKRAIIHPIPKVKGAAKVSDFRPISLLPILSKVLERLVCNRFIVPYVKGKLRDQFAYIPGPGSGTACHLTFVYNRILSFLDSPGAVRLLCVDFAKAFDKILHSLIISSVNRFGLSSNIVSWIGSFWADRFQMVRIGDNVSSWSPITSGVPQGSVLGPILFCMAVSSISSVCANSYCVMYADDLTVLHFVRNPADDLLQLEWDNIVAWSSANSLPVNNSKSCVFDIVTKKSLTLFPVTHSDGSFLKSVSSISLLGLTFSADLKWNFHFDAMMKKVSKRTYLMYNLVKSGCPSDLLVCAYISYIRSVFLYSFPSFCNASDYLLKRLVRFEKRILRVIHASPRLDILAAADAMCRRLFASIEANDSHPLRTIFYERDKTARNHLTLKPPFARTKRFSNSFIKFARAS
jgi:hypothetical protein